MRLVRITGSGFAKTGSITDGHPVEFRHWKDIVEEADAELVAAADQETEEAVVELWLEDPQSFNEVDTEGVGLKQGSMLRRADNFNQKRAAAPQQNWNTEFADAQAHVASVLKNLGNGADRNYQYRAPTPGKAR